LIVPQSDRLGAPRDMTEEKIEFKAKFKSNAPSLASVKHRTTKIDGVEIFYREAGPKDAPIVLLPHGYPCSSYEFRNFMPALADRLVPKIPSLFARVSAADLDRLGAAGRLHARGLGASLSQGFAGR
jgi:hypothetical protein